MSPPVLGYWVDAPGRGALRPTTLPTPGPGEVRLQALFTGISPGTERLVGLGRVPDECAAPMACLGMQGSFRLPLLYGYSFVGSVEDGADAGRIAFTMQPHLQHAVAARERLVLLPDAVPPARATLFPNLETALNATWDAQLHGSERVAVVGGGAVGQLLTFVLSRTLGRPVALVDRDPARRAQAARLPWGPEVHAPEALPRSAFDVVFHATGHGEGLQLALDALAFEGRVVELSWYGTTPVTVRLGGRFHYQRQRILASQVAAVAPTHRAGGHAARTAEVLRLLADAGLDALHEAPIPFPELPTFFARLYRGDATPPCPLVRYTKP